MAKAVLTEIKIQNRRTGKFKCKGSYGWDEVGYAWKPGNIKRHIGMMKGSGNWWYENGKRVRNPEVNYCRDDVDVDVVEYELIEKKRTPMKEVLDDMARKKLGKHKYDLDNVK
tara:strand:+ start:133 stop:471 length:339 start_codon:yes stop_codon:yes gene_type:complete